MPAAATPPIAPSICIAVVNDYEIVVAGLRAMLADHAHLHVVELDVDAVRDKTIDLVLYDTFGSQSFDEAHLHGLIEESGAKVVVFTWVFHAELIRRVLAAGAAGYLSKGMGADRLVAALEDIHRGEVVTSRPYPQPREIDRLLLGSWPGQSEGLSARESEILALITQGLSNQEIAEATYLSINSIKSYIRTAYRKLGIEKRTQAVRYGMRNGFEPAPTSVVS